MATNYNAGVGTLDENAAQVVSGRFLNMYALGTLGPTTAIDTGDLDTAGVASVLIVIKNGNTTLTRSVTILLEDEAGVAIFSLAPTAIAANTTVSYVIGVGVTSAGVTAAYSIPLASKLKITCAAPASGTGDGLVKIYGRS